MLKNISSILTQIPEENLEKFAQIILKHYEKRFYFIGNGGSSSTASHFASDLASLGFDTICLSDNTPRLTAITNDYGWEEVYIKQLSWIKSGDILIAISVHGGADDWSNNLTKAVAFAKGRGATTIALSGFDGGQLAKLCDLSIIVPAKQTYIIEGIHGILFHVICKKLEENNTCNK